MAGQKRPGVPGAMPGVVVPMPGQGQPGAPEGVPRRVPREKRRRQQRAAPSADRNPLGFRTRTTSYGLSSLHARPQRGPPAPHPPRPLRPLCPLRPPCPLHLPHPLRPLCPQHPQCPPQVRGIWAMAPECPGVTAAPQCPSSPRKGPGAPGVLRRVWVPSSSPLTPPLSLQLAPPRTRGAARGVSPRVAPQNPTAGMAPHSALLMAVPPVCACRAAPAGGTRDKAAPGSAGHRLRLEGAGGRPRAGIRAQGRSAILEKFGGAAKGPAPHLRRSGGAATVKTMLLEWCRARTRGYPNVDVQNFSGSWGSGLAFCALLHSFFPDAFDFAALEPNARRDNSALAFATAEERAGCAPLLEVEDMVRLPVPDAKCVYTYVQELYRCLVAKGLVKTKKR
uniref:Uncharacterized protein n=1 Tax=Geospiza parvula TaxID=87175 RepID=A0A8C3MZP3_GEOPR